MTITPEKLNSLINDALAKVSHIGPVGAINWFACQLTLPAERALEPQGQACAQCHGEGVVDDGYLTHSESGYEYSHPIKCVKDCSTCQGSGRSYQPQGQALPDSVIGIPTAKERQRPSDEWYRKKFAEMGDHEPSVIGGGHVSTSRVAPDVKEAVNRFLGWKLPKTFNPDCGISFDGRKDDEFNKNKTWPVGTNILTADEALAMFEYCLAGRASQLALPVEPVPEGFVLMPIETTEEMLKAVYPLHWWDSPGKKLAADYKTLVAAAPKPQTAGGAEPVNAQGLKCCPFCGDMGVHAERIDSHWWGIHCPNGDCPACSLWLAKEETEEECIRQFNRRAHRTASPAVAQPVADERARFEQWFNSQPENVIDWHGGDPYDHGKTMDAWEVWQARAALCQPAEEGGKS